MANVLGKFYSGVKLRKGATPESPTELIGVQPYPLNPPGSGNFVTIDTDQTITGEKNFDANTILGDSSTDYVLWDKISKVFSIFTQAQFTHKYRGGAAGALNIGQYDVDGNASVNNTSNGKLLLETNNTTRVEIEADGDVLLKKVDSGTGETLMIEPSGRVVKGSGGGTSITNLISGFSIIDSGGGATYSYSLGFARIVNFSGQRRLEISLSGISTTGTPTGELELNFSNFSVAIYYDAGITRLEGSNISSIEKRIPALFGTNKVKLALIDDYSSFASSVIFTSGKLSLYIYI